MTALVGFPLGTIYNITNITQDFPGVVTLATVADANSFAVATGMTVTISKVVGMLQINGMRVVIGSFDAMAKTFQMYDLNFNPVDTRGFQPYFGGGEINIISYSPPPGQPPGLMYNNQ